MFTQSIKFYRLHYHLKNVIHRIDSKMNVAPVSKFYAKIWVGFCLNTGKHFFLEVSFKPNRKYIDSSIKTVLEIFKIALRWRDWHVFMWQSVETLNDFNTLTLKKIFGKTKIFFEKLEYSFLDESTKIENALFPYKTAISEVSVKTNRMVSKEWTNHKERSFASNYFLLKTLFQFKNLL